MIIVVYGLGQKFRNNRKSINEILAKEQIIYSDKNYESLSSVYEFDIIPPENIQYIKYDYVVIIPNDYDEIKKALIDNGVKKSKIVSVPELQIIVNQGCIDEYKADGVNTGNKKILIINPDIGFHGGSIACYNIGKILISRGYKVDIACGSANKEGIVFFNTIGINIYILKSFPYVGGRDYTFIQKYDMIIANTLLTIRAAYFTHSKIPTIWWIHESEDNRGIDFYHNAVGINSDFEDSKWLDKINILAVSERAADAFKNSFGKTISSMPPGIQDTGRKRQRKNKKIIIATIGYVREDKNQLGFLKATEKIYNSNIDYWVIGRRLCNDDYFVELQKIANNSKNIYLKEEVSKEELSILYEDIDIVVCPSYIESLSLTIIEGMMNSKICITTDGTGIADYIEDGVNGFISEAGNIDSLAEKMQYAINNFEDLDEMRINARTTYEKYFTLDTLGDNIEREIEFVIEKHRNIVNA